MTTFEVDQLESQRYQLAGAPGVARRLWTAGKDWYLRRLGAARLAALSQRLRRDVGVASADDCDLLNDATAALWKKAHLPPNIR